MMNLAAPAGDPTLLLQHLFSGVLIYAPNARIVFANEAAGQMTGLSPDQLIGRSTADPGWSFVRENGTPLPLEEYPVNWVLATGQALPDLVLGINRAVTGDRVWVLVRAFPELSEQQTLQQIVVTFIDITARKHAEDALRRSEAKLRAVFN
ncbi:MAG: PAS domain-containing protein, partial [Chloroflexales bacterium]|nr:PAS domain-containing protein [Chloroflexales bacterium]